MIDHAKRLHETLEAVCPVSSVSVSISNETGLGTAVPIFGPGATEQQKTAALLLIAAFDWSEEAHRDWAKAKKPKGGLLDLIQNMTPDDKRALKDLLK